MDIVETKFTKDPETPVVTIVMLSGQGGFSLLVGERTRYTKPGGGSWPSLAAASAAAVQAFGLPADVPWVRSPGVVSVYRQQNAL